MIERAMRVVRLGDFYRYFENGCSSPEGFRFWVRDKMISRPRTRPIFLIRISRHPFHAFFPARASSSIIEILRSRSCRFMFCGFGCLNIFSASSRVEGDDGGTNTHCAVLDTATSFSPSHRMTHVLLPARISPP